MVSKSRRFSHLSSLTRQSKDEDGGGDGEREDAEGRCEKGKATLERRQEALLQSGNAWKELARIEIIVKG